MRKKSKEYKFMDEEHSVKAMLFAKQWFLYVDFERVATFDFRVDVTELLAFWHEKGRQDGAIKILLEIPHE